MIPPSYWAIQGGSFILLLFQNIDNVVDSITKYILVKELTRCLENILKAIIHSSHKDNWWQYHSGIQQLLEQM